MKAPDAQLTVGMHLLASGLIWLALSASQEHVRADLVDRLSRLPEAFLPDAPETAASEQEVSLLHRPCLMLATLDAHGLNTVNIQAVEMLGSRVEEEGCKTWAIGCQGWQLTMLIDSRGHAIP